MLTKRIIPCLDVRDGRVVKGVKFKGIRELDDPVSLARYYNDSGADELAFYDIAASVENRLLFTEILEQVVSCVSIPLIVGGGISSLDDFERILNIGADKVSVNSGAIKTPRLISDAAKEYGSRRVVLSIDVARADGSFHVFAKGGMEDTGLDAIEWAVQGENLGAGELVINSIDTDGVRGGFDIELLIAVSRKVSIPVIASGGAGSMENFLTLFNETGCSAGLAASIFHLKEVEIGELKRYLAKNGISVRV
ncbi:MAG TPA: imidazole glycerol phosphate synthase subunit HisF [Clostridiales bacterium]|nr:imidazole glycerol phosphate synthase subunit HisF [Clostridiales bacterium]